MNLTTHYLQVPVVNIQLKMMLVTVVLSFSFLNLFQPFYNIILTEGAGKNGTTVAVSLPPSLSLTLSSLSSHRIPVSCLPWQQ